MRGWDAQRIAQAAGARLLAPRASAAGRERAVIDAASVGPERAVIDSRAVGPGDLFIGLRGESVDGGGFAARALAAGAWGVLTAPEHAREAHGGVWMTAEDPLGALHRLARGWRRELGAQVIGVTGSTGKTSTKDLLHAVLGPHSRTIASRGNFNTEIGLPLEILGAPAGTEVLVLEMAMRGAGQIAELAAVAEPDVGVIVSVGPVHLELLGTIEAIAAAKAELIAGLAPGATAIVPAGETLLAPHLRDDLTIVTFGEGGDVTLRGARDDWVELDVGGELVALEVSFTQAHLRRNLLAAVAAARAVGVDPAGRIELALSPGRGQREQLPDGVTLIDDCYNANPMSMRAALDDLAETARRGRHSRQVAVLGDMLELGPRERELHLEIGSHAAATGVDVLVTVGPLAAAMTDRFDGEAYPVADAGEAAALLPELLGPGDAVLVKASRGVGLELVCSALQAGVA
jgi:UDP-N-acetylmuramoyl-tripeptide--D-alanyl-D-alanine ligase